MLGPMTVGDLLDWLDGQPRDRRILLSQDPAGNHFSFLAEVGLSMVVDEYADHAAQERVYRPDRVYPTDADLDARIAAGEKFWGDEDRAPKDAVPAIVLWPL